MGHGLGEMFPDWVEAIWGDDVFEKGIIEASAATEFDRYYRRYFSGMAIKG